MTALRATSRGDEGRAQTVTLSNGHEVQYDEPREKGGRDAAPSPTATLASALAACIAITMRMYAERKEWDLTGLEVAVEVEFDGPRPSRFTVELDLPDGLEQDQIDRLRVIATKCPVHRALSETTEVEVT